MSESEIAVVGLAGRFPGASDAREYWIRIRDGVECIRRYSDDELLAAGVSPEQLANPRYVRAGAPLDDMADFDAEFFGFSPKDAAIMDPQHRHFLEVAWEALEDAGHPPSTFDGPIGVFAGCGMNAYMMFNLLTNPSLVESVGLFLLRHTGNDKDFLATRVSYCLDLKGPSISIQTACSTSLVAIHTASQSLLSGECDLALAGGVTIEQPHARGYLYEPGEILSSDGHCRAFDRAAEGTVFGSGAGVVVLRRLDDALADRDHIHAVIRGSAINNDGSSKVGYLAPSVDGQAEAIAEAIAVAGVRADEIQYVEAHGTGTPVGDPIEIAALTRAFRASTEAVGHCSIGSVKPNIGHLDTAAGVASFVKVCQALRHRQMPPSLHFEQPNPDLGLDDSPFRVNATLRDWPRGAGPRLAGVSSLGVGGTNAHVILEEAPERPARPARRALQLLTVSARNAEALDATCRRLAGFFEAEPETDLADAAYTLHVGRREFAHRRSVLCRDLEEAGEQLQARRSAIRPVAGTPGAVFMFPGGGAQYPRMGAGLYASEPVFREAVDRGLALLQQQAGIELQPHLFPEPSGISDAARALTRPSLQLPALFILEHALATLWRSWGIEPRALVGHSMGENTAACVAGVFRYEDALALVTLRGRLFERVPEGGMLSVPLPADELSALLAEVECDEPLCLAAVNGPSLCVASGSTASLAALEGELGRRDVDCQRVKIDIAAHSHMLDPILPEFGAFLRSLTLSAPEIPFVSNLTGRFIDDAEATDPAYWVRHLRGTVRFADDVRTLLEEPGRVLIEVGPGKTLGSLARQSDAMRPGQPILASLRHPDEQADDQAFVLERLGDAWCAGLSVDWPKFHDGEERARVSLPGYAFQRQRFWIEPGKPVSRETDAEVALEKIANPNDWFFQPVWTRVPVPVPEDSDARHTWLILLDSGGIGTEIAEQLRSHGHRVMTVREGDAYYQVGPDEYALAPEEGRDVYDRLFGDLAASDSMPDRIVHLWTLTLDEQARPGSSFYHHIQERGFYSLLFIAQALGELDHEQPLHISVVSNDLQRVNDESLRHPEKATLLGPCKVIPQEYPGMTCSNIDVVLPRLERRFSRKQAERRRSDVARALLEELRSRPETSVVAYRDGERWQQILDPFVPEPGGETHGSVLEEAGVYLITGGLGGVGLVMAEHLAQHHRARLVLVGRSALPARDQWPAWLDTHPPSHPVSAKIRRLQALEAQGAELLPLVADVANYEQMKAVLQAADERFGGVDGVFHAAGVLDDGLIQLKRQEEIEAVFAPKIQGTLVLDQLFSGRHLDFLLLFSSTSSMIGAAGQVDYVAANCFLDAFAHSRMGGPVRVEAINWGVWNEVGMAAAAAAGEPAGEAKRVAHPLLGEVRRESEDVWVFASELAPPHHWVLDEHRTREGHALLPGTGYLELAYAAHREALGEGPAELRDLVFLSPLRVHDDGPTSLRVRIVRDGASCRFTVESRQGLLSNAGAAGWQVHAEGRIATMEGARPEPIAIDSLKARCDRHETPYDPEGIATGQEAHLAFGPRWRCLRQIRWGKTEALALLELPDAFAGETSEFALHPALLDLATGYAMELVAGYGPDAPLYVPLSYQRFRVHAPLGDRMYSHVSRRGGADAGDGIVSFDIQLCDADGRVLVEIEQFTIRKLDATKAFAAKPATTNVAVDSLHASPAELAFRRSLAAGIRPAEGAAALERVLSSRHQPQVIVSSIALDQLIAQLSSGRTDARDESARFERPNLATDYVGPRDEIETALVEIFQDLLGVDRVGVDDDFFELGGHSLIAVRLFARIRQQFDVEYPISLLFDAPTVDRCAARIREDLGEGHGVAKTSSRPGFRFLVPMHRRDDSSRRPFFLVAGMFGNVLNLRHLAGLIGSDRPFYSIQARGLHGDDRPHESFPEMAREYLEEVRQVQPHGPYQLGGFSGGGITAYEMAQQLIADGETVSTLAFLDTPTAQPSEGLRAGDKIRIHLQRLARQGPAYLTDWLRRRIAWEIEQRSQEKEPSSQPFEFRSREIEIGFRTALDRYETLPYPGRIHLFRPPLDESHVLSGGRVANRDREFVYGDNGWSAFARDGVVVEVVPGDHDSMVLEPNVRVLAEKLRGILGDGDER